jgi:hypothetical protein
MAAGLRPPTWIFENLKVSGNSFCGSKVDHQISKGSLKKGLKVARFSKIQDGRRPTAAILIFLFESFW